VQDPDLRQAAVYGLGIAAQHRADAFRPVAQQSSQLLLAIAAAPDAHSDANASATDNAVAALGKVLASPGPPGPSLQSAVVLLHAWHNCAWHSQRQTLRSR
jgi:importin-5